MQFSAILMLNKNVWHWVCVWVFYYPFFKNLVYFQYTHFTIFSILSFHKQVIIILISVDFVQGNIAILHSIWIKYCTAYSKPPPEAPGLRGGGGGKSAVFCVGES